MEADLRELRADVAFMRDEVEHLHRQVARLSTLAPAVLLLAPLPWVALLWLFRGALGG